MKEWIFVIMIMANCWKGECIKCFQCDNVGNPACGESFKAYQFPAENCPGSRYKCGLQRQKKKGEFVGIIRACYLLGSLNLPNETDGCQEILFHEHNDTSSFCLCSKDYCNRTFMLTASFALSIISASISAFVVMCSLRL
ncbi:hypothetical protein ACF0H5_016268 [Mactra antiquata]